MLLISRIGRGLQPDIIERIFPYWRELLGIELPPGMRMRGHAEFIMGGALAMRAWRARQPEPIPAREFLSPAFVSSIGALLKAL